jgi:glycosyltransferase involved in cell wall biosynthesis
MSEESQHLVDDTVYLPPVTGAAVFASQIFWLLRAPGRYLRALALVAAGRYQFDNDPMLWLHGLVDFARGAYLARIVDRDGGFRHLHAQFADGACTTTLVASLLTGIPFSFRSHTSLNPQIITEKVRRAQFVVSISRYDKEVLVQWCGEPAAAKIQVNYLGVPLDRYVPGSGVQGLSGVQGFRCSGVQVPAKSTAGPSWTLTSPEHLNTRTPEHLTTPEHLNTPPLILAIGTLCAKKGFEDLVRACRLLADRGMRFRCLIVGSGPLRPRLEEIIEGLGLHDHVKLEPYKPQEEIRRLLRRAAIFTLPCIYPLDGTVDGIPVVLMEAMAMGLPVVSTAVSGIPELVRHEHDGLLVPEKDYEALAEGLSRLLGDPELARRLGAAARENAVRRFDAAANAAKLAEFLRAELPELGVPAHEGSRANLRSRERSR